MTFLRGEHPRRAPIRSLLLAVAVITTLAVLQPSDATEPDMESQSTTAHPNFVSRCKFSHRASDDPIVFPNQPGTSHSHDFFGNRSTRADSTETTMLAATTTCPSPDDTSGMWVPTLYVDGQPLAALKLTAYYSTGGKPAASVMPFPAGLKVIAGSASSHHEQPTRIAAWSCGADGQKASTPPTCPDGSELTLRLGFPDCWDGTNTDSADHKSHMSYAVRGRCDEAHPVPVPRLSFIISYPTTNGPAVTLASGSGMTAHADFWNTWDQGRLEQLVNDCLNAQGRCGGIR